MIVQSVVDVRKDGTLLLATVVVALVRVEETPYDKKGNPLGSADDPAFHHFEWLAGDPGDRDALARSCSQKEPVRVPGYPGRYLSYVEG